METEELIELLRSLVQIPSVNPDECADPAVRGEERLARMLQDHFEQAGFSVTLAMEEPGRPNLIAACGEASRARTLLIEGHLDTVSIEGMSIDPFRGEVREGRLYGRGACDTKGPIAAFLAALTPRVLEAFRNAECRLLFVGASGEEQGNEGAQYLVDNGLVRADQAIVLEPTELAIVTAHKGALWFQIEVTGRPGHGSAPDQGRSAIHGMIQVLNRIEAIVDLDGAGASSEFLGPPTVNVGRIQGGSAVNIVPGSCIIDVDRRTLPQESHAGILDRARSELETLQSTGAIEGYAIHILKDCKPFETSRESALLRRLAAACDSIGIAARAQGTAWYSDAGQLSRVCEETVVFGPGSIAQAHTSDEFIEIDQLRQGAMILEAFLLQTAAGS